jgi:hypothetical protein
MGHMDIHEHPDYFKAINRFINGPTDNG